MSLHSCPCGWLDTKVGFSLLSASVNSFTAKHALVCRCNLPPCPRSAILNSAFCELISINSSGDSRLFRLRVWVQSLTNPYLYCAQTTMTGTTDYTSESIRVSLIWNAPLRCERSASRCASNQPAPAHAVTPQTRRLLWFMQGCCSLC